MLMSNQLQPDELFGLAGTTDTLHLFNDAGEIQNACTTNKIKRKFECLYFLMFFRVNLQLFIQIISVIKITASLKKIKDTLIIKLIEQISDSIIIIL